MAIEERARALYLIYIVAHRKLGVQKYKDLAGRTNVRCEIIGNN
jgi:hypothetical protein